MQAEVNDRFSARESGFTEFGYGDRFSARESGFTEFGYADDDAHGEADACAVMLPAFSTTGSHDDQQNTQVEQPSSNNNRRRPPHYQPEVAGYHQVGDSPSRRVCAQAGRTSAQREIDEIRTRTSKIGRHSKESPSVELRENLFAVREACQTELRTSKENLRRSSALGLAHKAGRRSLSEDAVAELQSPRVRLATEELSRMQARHEAALLDDERQAAELLGATDGDDETRVGAKRAMQARHDEMTAGFEVEVENLRQRATKDAAEAAAEADLARHEAVGALKAAEAAAETAACAAGSVVVHQELHELAAEVTATAAAKAVAASKSAAKAVVAAEIESVHHINMATDPAAETLLGLDDMVSCPSTTESTQSSGSLSDWNHTGWSNWERAKSDTPPSPRSPSTHRRTVLATRAPDFTLHVPTKPRESFRVGTKHPQSLSTQLFSPRLTWASEEFSSEAVHSPVMVADTGRVRSGLQVFDKTRLLRLFCKGQHWTGRMSIINRSGVRQETFSPRMQKVMGKVNYRGLKGAHILPTEPETDPAAHLDLGNASGRAISFEIMSMGSGQNSVCMLDGRRRTMMLTHGGRLGADASHLTWRDDSIVCHGTLKIPDRSYPTISGNVECIHTHNKVGTFNLAWGGIELAKLPTTNDDTSSSTIIAEKPIVTQTTGVTAPWRRSSETPATAATFYSQRRKSIACVEREAAEKLKLAHLALQEATVAVVAAQQKRQNVANALKVRTEAEESIDRARRVLEHDRALAAKKVNQAKADAVKETERLAKQQAARAAEDERRRGVLSEFLSIDDVQRRSSAPHDNRANGQGLMTVKVHPFRSCRTPRRSPRLNSHRIQRASDSDRNDPPLVVQHAETCRLAQQRDAVDSLTTFSFLNSPRLPESKLALISGRNEGSKAIVHAAVTRSATHIQADTTDSIDSWRKSVAQTQSLVVPAKRTLPVAHSAAPSWKQYPVTSSIRKYIESATVQIDASSGLHTGTEMEANTRVPSTQRLSKRIETVVPLSTEKASCGWNGVTYSNHRRTMPIRADAALIGVRTHQRHGR